MGIDRPRITDQPGSPERDARMDRYAALLRPGPDACRGVPDEHEKRVDRAERMEREVILPDRVRGCPRGWDVLPEGSLLYKVDHRKFSEYSLNPGHPDNNGKAAGWRAVGYNVDDPAARAEAAEDLAEICRMMAPRGWAVKIDETPSGRRHRVLSGFIGPNGAHGTLNSCWLVSGESTRLATVWMQPHREKGDTR